MTAATEELPDVEEQTEPVAEAPAPIPPEPPADCPVHIRQHYDAIREKEREVYALEGEYLSLKEQSGEAKREFEQADKALRNLIARGADPQRTLPFDEPAKPTRYPKKIKTLREIDDIKAGTEFDNVVVHADLTTVEINIGMLRIEVKPDDYEVIEWNEIAPPAAENDAWRAAPFADLGLTEKQNDLFESIGVRTIGDLEDLRARMAEGKPDAQWPKGIGPAKVTDIENRIVDWLDKNRDKFGEVVAAAEVPSAAASEPVIPEPADETLPIHKPRQNSKAKHKANGKAKSKAKGKRR